MISVGSFPADAAGFNAARPDGATSLYFLRFQFTNRRMRMFITIPKARNMNSTDDPP